MARAIESAGLAARNRQTNMRLCLACALGLLVAAGCAPTAHRRPTAAKPAVSTAHPPGPRSAAVTGGAGPAAARPAAARASGGVRATLVIPPRPASRDSVGAGTGEPRLICAGFDTPLAAQVALAAGHYYLDPDGDGVACEQVEEETDPRR